jgi:type II secretory pathway component PulF
MVKTGEKTGQLEQMLKHVSDAYDTEVQQKIASVIALIEPLMVIMMMGGTVVIIMAIMIPMLSVMNQVRG